MSTGLFIHRGVGQGRAFQKSRRQQATQREARIVADTRRRMTSSQKRISEFAEALSVEFTIAEAAELVGVSLRVGQNYFRRICADVEAAGLMRCV